MIYRKQRKTWIYLFLATGSVLLLAVASFTIVSLVALRDSAYVQTEDNLKQFSYSIAHFISAQSEPMEGPALQKFCKAFGTKQDFRISIIAKDGSVIADSSVDPATLENHGGRPEVASALSGYEKGNVRFSNTLNKPLVYFALPYKDMVIRISVPVNYIDSASREMMLTIIIAAVIILLAALAVSYLVSSRIIFPLKNFETAARSFSAGKLDIEFDSSGFPIEFVELSNTFSQMAKKLREKIEALDEQNRESKAILSGMNDALIVLDSNNTVLRVNRASENLFHFTSDETVGLPLLQAVRNTDIVDFAMNPEKGETERTVELRSPSKIGTQYLLVKSNGIEDSMDQLLVFTDITQLKKLERIRKDFVANVSHELKTPVTSLKGFIETLKDGAINDPEAARRFLDIMDGQASRLGAIIDDLLSISRLEQNEYKDREWLKKEDTRVCELMKDVQNLCQDEARKKKTSLIFSCPDNLICAVNPGLIEQAVTNLVFNAVKYSPPEAKVAVTVYLERDESNGEDRLICTVADNGIGIPEKDQARIFERFYRIDKGRSRDQGGTGLGLSIVRHIALAHGGSVSVESTEGVGSVFKLEIPV